MVDNPCLHYGTNDCNKCLDGLEMAGSVREMVSLSNQLPPATPGRD